MPAAMCNTPPPMARTDERLPLNQQGRAPVTADNVVSFEEWLSGKPAQPATPRIDTPPPQFIGGADEQQRTWTYIEGIAGRQALLAKGSRNETENQGAYKAFRLALGVGIPLERVEEIIYHANVLNGQVSDDSEKKVRGTLASARSGAEKDGPEYLPPPQRQDIPPAFVIDPNEVEKVAPGTPRSAPAENAAQSDQLAEALSRFTDGASFILDIPETVPAIWGSDQELLWVEGESLMIAGPMGLGKTTLGGQLMRAQLGLGKPEVLDLPVTPAAGRILYLAMDRPAQARRAMARQFTGNDRQTLAERLIVWPGPPPADIAKYPAMLLWLAEQADAEIVYLDSVKDAAIGLSEDEVGAGYNRARQQLLASGRQLCELHHTTKRGANGGPPKDVSDIYGSTWITNGTGSIILLSGAPGDPIVGMHHARQPMEEVGPYKLLHDQATGAMSIMHETNLLDLARHAGPDGLTAKGAAAAITGDDAEPSAAAIEKARRRLDKLVAQRLLRRVDGDKSKSRPAVWFLHEGTSFDA